MSLNILKKLSDYFKNMNGYRIENIISNRVIDFTKKYSMDRETIERYGRNYRLFNEQTVAYFVQDIGKYINQFVEEYATKRGYNPNESILDLLEEENVIENSFDCAKFEAYLNESSTYVYRKIRKNPYLRRKIFNIALFEIVNTGGKIVGPERALLFNKLYPDISNEFQGCDAGIPAMYASYDTNDENDEKFIRFMKIYKNIGDGSETILWFPHYFENNKYWDCAQELREKIDSLPVKVKNEIRNSKQKYMSYEE